MFKNRNLIFVLALLSLAMASCGEDQVVFDNSMVPEVSSIPVDKDTSLYDFLGLTDKQKLAFDEEIEQWNEKARMIVESEDKNARAALFQEGLLEHDKNLFQLLDKEQKNKFLDFKAYRIERGKPRQLMQSAPSQ